MSKARLIITAVTIQGLIQAEAARTYGVSKGWVSKLIARWRLEGEAAFEPHSRRPRSSPNALAASTVELILKLRHQLTERGLDAGAHTIAGTCSSTTTASSHSPRPGAHSSAPA